MTPQTTTAPTRRRFAAQFGSTRRGARLARLLATRQLARWGWPPGSEASRTAALLVAELAANAVIHGRVPGRDFLLGLTAAPGLLRIEVSDARGERPPAPSAASSPAAESGRGLLLVTALAARWGTEPRHPSGKTVWCELELPLPLPGDPTSAPAGAEGGRVAAATQPPGGTPCPT